ncbi:MAG: pyridoxal-phosphate dependent enzyme, partial [Actinomycetota bacterium]|nr:pyridoxal-phosphate dependent enzyme [Actinomycetota bacterium]
MTALGHPDTADQAGAAPRFPLGILPTPLVGASRLGARLGIDLMVKRDDLIGFAQAGTKTRALEVLLADARAQGCDCLVGCGGPESNFLPAVAAAARVAGMDSHLVCSGDQPVGPTPPNVALARAWGATMTFTGDPDREGVEAAADAYAATLVASGRRPYVLPRGGATAVGVTGAARAVT